jgi:flagellar biosynthesis protein FlhG
MNKPQNTNRLQPGMTDVPKIYAIASGKGGVGKSVIAFNLAHNLAEKYRVLLIDGDFQMGNLHLLANAAPDYGWQSVCLGRMELSEAVKPIKENLDLLASTGGRSDELLPDLKSLASCLASLRNRTAKYDFIIIDTASGILPHTNLILNAIDEVILVTTPELTSISDCYAFYKILISNNKNLIASLLVNREQRQEEVEYIYQKFVTITDQFLNHSPAFLGYLGEDSVLVESVAHQQGLLDFAPNSPITNQFAVLAEKTSGIRSRSKINLETINFTPAGADIKE